MDVVMSLSENWRGSMLALVLVLSVFGCTDAASLADSRGMMDSTGLSDVTIISILSVASCVCLVIAVFGCACCCRRGFAKFEETTTETTVVGQRYTSHLSPDFSPPTMSTPSRPPGATEPETITIEPLPQLPGRTSNQWVNVLRVSGGSSLDPSQTMQSIKLIDSPRFQFPRSQISYVDEMGNGWFGKVLQGEAQRMHPGLRKTRVVVKQLRDTATPEEQLLFLQEVQPYREVNHPNVLLLLGQCIDSMPLLLILEYAPFGDLKSYLRKHRDEVQEMAQQDIQLKMAADMVSGLMWLHQADFIYIDLATRNCQVSADTSVKIGDYGLALEKYPDDYYITKDNSQAIPIRWLGPEVIDLSEDGKVKTKKVTKESNVWSFGIMMLELSTGAKRPYAKLTDDQVLQQVVKEQEIRVDKPNLNIHYASRWFEVMMYCWLEADIRPTMKQLHDLIMYLKNNRDRVDMPDFEERWNSLKPAALQESSESSKEEEEPSVPVQKNPPQSGFKDDFVHPLATTPEKGSPLKKTGTPVIVPPPPKSDSPAKVAPSGFDSDFGSALVASAVSAVPVISNEVNAPSPNRNMNAQTNLPNDQQMFEDEFVTAVVQPSVESIPQPAERGNPTMDGFQSQFVTQTEVLAMQSAPSFPGLDGGVETKDASPKKTQSGHEVEVFPSSALGSQDSPAVSAPEPAAPLDAPRDYPVIDSNAATPVILPDTQRTSTPVSDETFESSANMSVVTPAKDEGSKSFLSTASLSFTGTPAPNEVSLTFHSVVSPGSEDQSFLSFDTENTTPSTNYQTPGSEEKSFLSFDTENTTSSTNYQTPNQDQTQTSVDDTFDTFTSSQSEEPTFIIKPDTAPVDVQSSNPFSAASDSDHSPEFTSFVTAEIPEPQPSAEEQPVPAVPSSDATPLSFGMDSGVETDGSLVVEPPGDETIRQSGLLDFTDSSTATPGQLSVNTSDLSLLPSSSVVQSSDSPFTITMSMQGADGQQEGALSVQSQSGGMSVNRTVTSSSSSSSSTTRVVKTTRVVRRVQVVGGKEVVTTEEVVDPEGEGVVSVVQSTGEADGSIVQTFSGGELQSSSSSVQQMSSFQSSHQTTSSSMTREISSGEKLVSFNVSPGGEMTSGDGSMSITRQISGETSSSVSVRQMTSSQKVSSFTSSEMSGGATSVLRQVSGEGSSSVTRQFSSSSSSSSSSLTTVSSGEMVQIGGSGGDGGSSGSGDSTSALQQVGSTENTLSKQMSGGELTFTLAGGSDGAVLQQFGGSTVSAVSHSSSSQSMTRSEVSSTKTVSSSEQDGEGQSSVTMSRSMSASKSEQQSSSFQLMTQSSGDAQQPVTFDISTLSLGAPSGTSLVEADPGAVMEKTMTVTTGPGQMTVGQEMTMQGGGSAVGELENGGQVSMQWQGSAAVKQERSVFSSEVTSDGSLGLLEGLAGQTSQLAITSPEGDTPQEN